MTAMDVVIYAGPVVLKRAFQEIEWDRPTRLVEVQGAGSSNFQSMAYSLRSSERILPQLLRKYVGMDRSEIGKLALCSYSAGWGLLNEVFRIDADRDEVDAAVLSDSAFGGPLLGMEAMAADAMRGRQLMVVTNTNNAANWAAGIHKTARETVVEMMTGARELANVGRDFRGVTVREPLTQPSGGAWKIGQCYWLDYVAPGSPPGSGNDYTHGEHHDLAAPTWEAYLVPYLGGRLGFPWGPVIAGSLVAAASGYAAWRHFRR